MKRISLTVAFILLLVSSAWAGWELTPSKVATAGHYIKWKVVCTGDGAALAATDLLPLLPDQLLRQVQGQTLMVLKVYPGEGGVIPDNTFTVTLSDEESDVLWTKAAISEAAISWHDLSSDIGIFIPITGSLYLTINDIGTNGDQVTLYFISWKE